MVDSISWDVASAQPQAPVGQGVVAPMAEGQAIPWEVAGGGKAAGVKVEEPTVMGAMGAVGSALLDTGKKGVIAGGQQASSLLQMTDPMSAAGGLASFFSGALGNIVHGPMPGETTEQSWERVNQQAAAAGQKLAAFKPYLARMGIAEGSPQFNAAMGEFEFAKHTVSEQIGNKYGMPTAAVEGALDQGMNILGVKGGHMGMEAGAKALTKPAEPKPVATHPEDVKATDAKAWLSTDTPEGKGKQKGGVSGNTIQKGNVDKPFSSLTPEEKQTLHAQDVEKAKEAIKQFDPKDEKAKAGLFEALTKGNVDAMWEAAKAHPEKAAMLGIGATALGTAALADPEQQKEVGAAALGIGAILSTKGHEGGVASALGPLLNKETYTLKTLERLPANRIEFTRGMIEQEMNRADVSKGEKNALLAAMEHAKSVGKMEGDKITAVDLVNEFKLATGSHTLAPRDATWYASFGLDNIDREGASASNLGQEATDRYLAQGKLVDDTSTIWQLPEHMEMSDNNHFNDPRYFGHTRSFKENDVRHVVEIQSDLVQHTRGVSAEELAQLPVYVGRITRELDEANKKANDADIEYGTALTEYYAAMDEKGAVSVNEGTELSKAAAKRREAVREEQQLRIQLQELQVKLNSGAISSQLADMIPHWPRRLIREELARAAEAANTQTALNQAYENTGSKGEYTPAKVVRFATADTVAKVEGWPNVLGAKDKPAFRPEHQGIYDRYKRDVEKFLKQQGGVPYTDSHGHTWVEVPVPKSPLRQMYGNVSPELASKVALGTGGALLGAAMTPGDGVDKALGGIFGGLAGVGLAHAGKMAFSDTGKLEAHTELAEHFNALVGKTIANKIGVLKTLAAIPKIIRESYVRNMEIIDQAIDNPEIPLNAAAKAYKEKYIDPLRAQTSAMRDQLKAWGVNVGTDIAEHGHWLAKGKTNIAELAKKAGAFFEDKSPQGRGLSQFAPSFMERRVFALDSSDGSRVYVVRDEKGNGYTAYRDGKIIGSGKAKPAEYASGQIPFGKEIWTRVDVPKVDIEQHTPMRYIHDPMAAAIDDNARVTEAFHNVQYVRTLLPQLEKEGHATSQMGSAPADWREVGIPQLKGWKFSPRIANVLDDFANTPQAQWIENTNKVARVLTGALFWNPQPHIMNVLLHGVVNRGLVSDWANPMAYHRGLVTSIRAAKSVWNQDATYARFVKEGAGTMYAKVLVDDFNAKVMKQLGSNAHFDLAAKAWGYASGTAMVKAVYGWSKRSLWAANDMILMQAFLEKEMVHPEMTTREIIRDVERHIPNYRIPDLVAGSRSLSQIMRSPLVLQFGRYEYGRLRSYGAMIKDVVSGHTSLAEKAKALDQMATLAVLGTIVYPALDNLLKQALGNPNASLQRWGSVTIPYVMLKYFNGDSTFDQAFQSAFPVGSATKAAVEYGLTGRDTFTGKPLDMTPKGIVVDAAKRLSPVQSAANVYGGRVSGKQFVLSTMGVKAPTTEQAERAQKRHETVEYRKTQDWKDAQQERKERKARGF